MSGEDELISRAQAGDTNAFCLLAAAHERRIYSLALQYCRHPQDAEDLSQEVWLKAYRAISTFRHESSFYTWLRQITIRCFLNYKRARTVEWGGQVAAIRFVNVESLRTLDNPMAPSLEITLSNKLLVETVMRALSELTPQQRLIFLLKHHEGMTYQEISTSVGCSIGSVKKSLFRTVKKIRDELATETDAKNYVQCAAANY